MLIPFVNRFFHWAVVGTISPVLVLMIMSKGAQLEEVGFAMAAMSLSVVVFELPSGVLSDLMGRRRVYMASIAIAVAGYVIMFVADRLAVVCVAVALYGVSRAFSSGSIEALYIDSFIARRGKGGLHSLVAAMSVGETLGLAVGALAGGYIPLLWKRLYPLSNPYNGNLLVQVALLVALLALTVLAPHRDAPRGDAPAAKTKIKELFRESARAVRGNPVVARLLIGAVFWGFSFSAIEVYWQPRMRGLLGGADATWLFGIVGSAYFATAIAGNVVAGAFLKKARPSSGMAAIGVLRLATGCAIVALAMQGAAPGFVALFLTVMCCNGMMSIPEGTAFNAAIPGTVRASLLSLASLAVQAGGILSALACSAALRFFPIGAVWVAVGSLLLGSAFLYFGAPDGRPLPSVETVAPVR
ncbi:MAG: MFS transporter [Spirochaetae bacterium HGW-Spirochaetae-3]|jgi:MFS family permease|nr:MAG: MFS transporter [Spirochaetae bacterium HGW-Spirochaetae-3]